MKRHYHQLLSVFITLAIAIGFHTMAFAGLSEGFSAYKAGNYSQAIVEWMPLANQGNTVAQEGSLGHACQGQVCRAGRCRSSEVDTQNGGAIDVAK